MISIGKNDATLYFGEGIVISRLETDSLTYGDGFPGRVLWEKEPLPRKITIEGYMTASADSAEECARELTMRRNLLSHVTSPDESFFVNINGRIAHLRDGRLSFRREAPFNGTEAEHFTLQATIVGGYFTADPITVAAAEEVHGFHFPLSGELITGTHNGTSVVRVNNRGDIPVGFTATFSPVSTVSAFVLECPQTGKRIVIPKDLGSGDALRVSTHRDDLRLQLLRGGRAYDITGSATGESELFLLPRGESELYVGVGSPFEGSITYSEAFVSF